MSQRTPKQKRNAIWTALLVVTALSMTALDASASHPSKKNKQRKQNKTGTTLATKALKSGIPSWRERPTLKRAVVTTKPAKPNPRPSQHLKKLAAEQQRKTAEQQRKTAEQSRLAQWKKDHDRRKVELAKKKAEFNKQLQKERTNDRHMVFQHAKNEYRGAFDPAYKSVMSHQHPIGIKSGKQHQLFAWRVADHKGLRAMQQPLHRLEPKAHERVRRLLLAVRKGIDKGKKGD